MRILVVGNLYPPIVFGGYEILCAQVCRELEQRGHQVRVLTSAFRASEAPAQEGVERSLRLTTDFPLPGQDVGQVDFSLAGLQAVARFNRQKTLAALKAWPAQVVFAWCLNRLSLGPLFAANQLGLPTAYTINDEHPRQFAFTTRPRGPRQAARWLAERCWFPLATAARLRPLPAMTIISQALKDNLLTLGAPVQSALVIHQGVPLDQFPPAAQPRQAGQPLRLLYAGQLSRVKGVHTILEALGRLSSAGQGDFVMDIAGEGVAQYKSELRATVQRLDLAERVNFLGQVGREAMPALHQDHQVLVFASEWAEPFGLSHLEAMASGLAVVSTTTGGSAELIRDGQNALAFAAGDPADLAAKLARLLADEPLRRRLAQAGRRWVEERHSFSGYVDRLEGWLGQVMAAQRGNQHVSD